MGDIDIVNLILRCPPDYFSTLFNISSNITPIVTTINLIVIISWFILRKINNRKMESRSVADNLDDREVRNKYSVFIYRLTSIYLTLLVIFVFYGVFFLDKTCWYKVS